MALGWGPGPSLDLWWCFLGRKWRPAWWSFSQGLCLHQQKGLISYWQWPQHWASYSLTADGWGWKSPLPPTERGDWIYVCWMKSQLTLCFLWHLHGGSCQGSFLGPEYGSLGSPSAFAGMDHVGTGRVLSCQPEAEQMLSKVFCLLWCPVG